MPLGTDPLTQGACRRGGGLRRTCQASRAKGTAKSNRPIAEASKSNKRFMVFIWICHPTKAMDSNCLKQADQFKIRLRRSGVGHHKRLDDRPNAALML